MPDLVICFIPNEPALHAAFAADPTLFDYALERNVLLVSPTSLIGLLRTMELGWRQERMVAEAAEIAEAAGDPAHPLRQVPHRLRQGRQTARLGGQRLQLRGRLDGAAGCCRSCARSRTSASPPARRSSRPSRSRSRSREITAPELRESHDAA